MERNKQNIFKIFLNYIIYALNGLLDLIYPPEEEEDYYGKHF